MTPVCRTGRVANIPVLWAEPSGDSPRCLALWLHAFGGAKEDVRPQLVDLANQGFVALSWDADQHGERRREDGAVLKTRVRSNLRQHFWPILANTAEEAPRIIDWAEAELGVGANVAVGGISMGGDIAVAAAGVDRRIGCVGAAIATADWLRPGALEPQGVADDAGWEVYHRRNPLTNLSLYRHRPAILFACGEHDRQVPSDGAQRFVEALSGTYKSCPDRLMVAIDSGTSHSFSDAMWRRIGAWFVTHAHADGRFPAELTAQ